MVRSGTLVRVDRFLNRGAAGVACRTFLGESVNKSNEKVPLDRTLLLPRSPHAEGNYREKMITVVIWRLHQLLGKRPFGQVVHVTAIFRQLTAIRGSARSPGVSACLAARTPSRTEPI
jgi:hypothetical protein